MDATTMAAACAATERIVENVRDDELGLPTPCHEWDVRSLLNHLVGSLMLGEALLSGSPPAVMMGPGELPESDVLDPDPLKAYRAAAERLLATATDDALAKLHSTPLGDMPGAILAGFTTLDIAVHGWDLAVATGQDPTLDEPLATTVLAFARQTISPEMRAPRIGPEVSVDATSVTDELVAFLGRNP